MEKKEFPKRGFFKRDLPEKAPAAEEGGGGGGFKAKVAHWSSRFFSILKFTMGVGLLVFIYTFTRAFLKEIKVVDPSSQNDFWAGVSSYLVFYLFIYEPARVYRRGQKILEAVFKFFAPLVKTAPYVLPIYSIIIFCLYGILSFFMKKEPLLHYFLFLFSFSLAFHIIFTAKTLRSRQGDFIKSNYLFGMSFIYILNIWLAAFAFTLIFDKFSFVSFFKDGYAGAGSIFQAMYKQIFLPGTR